MTGEFLNYKKKKAALIRSLKSNLLALGGKVWYNTTAVIYN